MRTDPAPSVPTLSGPKPAATAAAVPPDEPPGVFDGSHGLRVMPVSDELVSPLQPNSGVVVLPTSTAPASRSRAVAGASTSHGWSGSTVWLPRRVGQPRVRIRSLIDVGTPSSGPIGSPRRQRASLAVADSMAVVVGDEAERVELRIEGVDPLEHRPRRLDRRRFTAPVQLQQLGGRALREIGRRRHDP